MRIFLGSGDLDATTRAMQAVDGFAAGAPHRDHMTLVILPAK